MNRYQSSCDTRMRPDGIDKILEFMFWNHVHASWTEFFVLNHKMVLTLMKRIDSTSETINPRTENIFYVFRMPMQFMKVCFLGMDPYPDHDNATGLAFSVPRETRIPQSLRNIFKEIKNEYPESGYVFDHGDLTRWFREEGIFLYNCALTCVAGKSGSHLRMWSKFTDSLIRYISVKNEGAVFLLLGNDAGKKARLIDDKDRVVTAVHPSPLSASKGFFNSGVFRKIDELLDDRPVNWSL